MNTISRALAIALSSAVILTSPGLASYAAAAALTTGVSVTGTGTQAVKPVNVSFSGPANLLAPSSFNSGLSLQAAPLLGPAPLVNAGKTLVAPASLLNAPAAVLADPRVSPAAKVGVMTPAAVVSQKAASLSSEVSSALQDMGDLSKAQPTSLPSFGHSLQAILSGERFSSRAQGTFSTDAQSLGSLGEGSFLAKPAGDSIRQSAESENNAPAVPVPPAGSNEDKGGRSPRGNGPLWAKLVSGALALTPAILLGWPLLASGALISGGLVILASLGVASLPFMSDSTPRMLRSIPGLLIGGLGLAALGTAVTAFSWPLLSMGALAALGGWGFMRFARKGVKGNINDSSEIIATFFGALGAVAGAGLVLLSPAGLLAAGLTVLAYPVSLILLMHLPGWVGAALSSAFHGFYQTVKDVYRVMTSLRRDTVLRQRLQKYTSASIEKSAWSALTLGLLLWLPVLITEAVQLVVAGVVGTALGLARAPLMMLWGASHDLSKDSKVTKFLAYWAQEPFLGSKSRLFNSLERPLIAYANSQNILVSQLGALAIRGAQLLYLIYNVFITPVNLIGGFINAFQYTNIPYDARLHDPESLSLGKDELAGNIPDEPAPIVGSGRLAKFLAAGIGLVPVWFFGASLVTGGGIFAGIVLATAVSVALMPLMPSSAKFPGLLRRIPGTLLTAAGAYTLFESGRMVLLAGLPIWGVVAMSALALFGGIGLSNLITKVQDKETKTWRLDSPEYILGYAGALAVTTGLVVSLIGAGGPLAMGLTIAAYVLSPALLYHLPAWLWRGVRTSLTGFAQGISSVWKVMRSWTHETQFNGNLNAWYKHYLDKSFWSGTLFLVPWALSLAAWLSETALSVTVGLALGVLRAPTRFFEGAAQNKNATGFWAKFWTGYNRFMTSTMEDSKKTVFDPKVKGLSEAMNEKDPASSRPTLKAAFAFLGVRLVQLYWLLRLAVLTIATPLLVPFGIYKGIANARSLE